MAFIQPPVANDRYPHGIHFVKYDPQCSDRSFQYGCVGHIEFETGFLENAACCVRLIFATFGQIDISPAGKPVFIVPDGLTMSHENYFMHNRNENKLYRMSRVFLFYNVSVCYR